jgi:hypothetical protein
MYNPEDTYIKETSSAERELSKTEREVINEMHKKKCEYNEEMKLDNPKEQEEEQDSLEKFKEMYKDLSIDEFDGLFKTYGIKDAKLADLKARGMDINSMIDYDKQQVIKARKGQGYKTERGILFEHLLINQHPKLKSADIAGWFGSGTPVKATTEYDDRFNHTDGVIEFGVNSDDPKLAIDVTTASNPATLKIKAKRIMSKLQETGELSDIKYYEDEDEKAFPLRSIPRAIIAIDEDALDELCSEYKDFDKGFTDSHIQIFVLKEIEDQLLIQIEAVEGSIAKLKEKDTADLQKFKKFQKSKDKISHVLKEIQEILKDKKSSLTNSTWKRAEQHIKSSPAYKAVTENIAINI